MSLDRFEGPQALAHYLNALARLSQEPIRIVAYSHGCNLVKGASAHADLDQSVKIDQAVFLGCPHIFAEAQGGTLYAYRLAPQRFGRILNIAIPNDVTQTGIPNTVMGPKTARWMAWVPPQASAEDPDPDVADLYETAWFNISNEVKPEDRHAHLHGATVGEMAGRWLAGTGSLDDINHNNAGALPVIPAGDIGISEL